MRLTGLHILLTYACTYECDHCFVWSSPDATGTMTVERLERILRQAVDLASIEWIYFEGGEPFLYLALLRWGVRRARELGFKVGIVSNAYWSTGDRDASECLRDLSGSVDDLSLSCDRYHGGAEQEARVEAARRAASALGIPADVIRIASPENVEAVGSVGQLPPGESLLMFRGRAAATLADQVPHTAWNRFTACPFEDLREPGRVHVDPFGHVHVCQGISIGNLFETPLRAICDEYDPDTHPIVGALLQGGPAEVARRYDVPHAEAYADACHLCTMTRTRLRARFPDCLTPDSMYGLPATPWNATR